MGRYKSDIPKRAEKSKIEAQLRGFNPGLSKQIQGDFRRGLCYLQAMWKNHQLASRLAKEPAYYYKTLHQRSQKKTQLTFYRKEVI